MPTTTRLNRPLRSATARVRALDRSLALLAGMAFVMQVGVAVMLPLLPLYAQSLGATPFVLGLLTSGFAITLAIGQLGAGFMAERVASRRLIVSGIGIYAAANILIATSSSALLLILYRGLAGLGAGVGIVAERLYITAVADRARLAFANGIISAAYSAGTVAGPTIGGLLAAGGDLHLPFVVVGITSTLAAVAGLWLPKPPAERGTTQRSPVERGDAGTARVDEPAADRAATDGASNRRRLVVLFVVQAGFQASFGAFITTYAPFASERLAWTTAEIGIVFSMFGLGSVLLGPFLARLADRRGRRRFGIIGAAMILPFVLLYVAEAPRPLLYLSTVVAGAGVTTLEAAWFALLSDATDGGRRSRTFSTIVALSSLGIVVGSVTAAQIWERTGNIGLGMLVAAAAVGISGLALLAHPADDRPKGQSTPTTDSAASSTGSPAS